MTGVGGMSRIIRRQEILVFYNPLTTLCLQPSTLVFSWTLSFLVKILTPTNQENGGEVLKNWQVYFVPPFFSLRCVPYFSGLPEYVYVNICTDPDTLFLQLLSRWRKISFFLLIFLQFLTVGTTTVSHKQNWIFLASWEPLKKRVGSGSVILIVRIRGSGFVAKRHAQEQSFLLRGCSRLCSPTIRLKFS